MKVLLINGSPRKEGCTYTALCEVASALNECGVDTEIFHIGTAPLSGCIACGVCRRQGDGRCTLDDGVNAALSLMESCDGLIVGSPVHYAAAGGAITAFLDRMFYAGSATMAGKPGACVVSARRGGTTAAFDQLIKYFTISCMPVISSQYWNQVHGSTPDEVRQDLEGMQIMRTLGRNMAWLLRCIEAGKKAGISFPEREPFARTNFIR